MPESGAFVENQDNLMTFLSGDPDSTILASTLNRGDMSP